MALGLAALAAVTALAGSAALKPAEAHAWAWKDTCTAIIYNRTGAQSSVHPTSYIPIPPNPQSIAAFAAYAITGIPVNEALPLVNTGYPVPAYGCHAIVTTTSPRGMTSCAYSAPTTGANHFDCSDNVSFHIIEDDDDIAANVFIPAGSGPASPPPPGTEEPPREGPPALRAGDLPGNGWRSTKRFGRVGLVTKLMKEGSLPDSCQGGGPDAPDDVSPNLVSSTHLRHPRGPRGVGAVIGTLDTPEQARMHTADALSDHSIHCLRRLLTSKRFHTSASARPLSLGRFGSDVKGSQVVVKRRAHGRVRKAAYVSVIGASNERQSAVVMLHSAHRRPVGSRVTTAAVKSVLNDTGA
jgi:hypothetical protein